MKMGELRTKGNIGLEGTHTDHEIFFLDRTVSGSSLSLVPSKSPCAFTASMASGCWSQPGVCLHPLDGDLRPLAVPVACDFFPSHSSQFFLSACNTQPQRLPLITVRKREKNSCLNTSSQTPNPLGGFTVPPAQINSGTCNKKKIIFHSLCHILTEFTAGFFCPLI